MKNIIFAMAIIFPAVALADDGKYKHYAGVYISQPNVTIKTNGAWTDRHKFHSVGYGFVLGTNVFNRNVWLDLDGGLMMFSFRNRHEDNDLANASVTMGLYGGYEFFGFAKPYIGAGLGISIWFNNIDYSYSMDGTHYSGNTVTTRTNLSYMTRAGILFKLNDRFDLDFNAKYQNMGRVKNKIPVYDIDGDIKNIEFRGGLLVKF